MRISVNTPFNNFYSLKIMTFVENILEFEDLEQVKSIDLITTYLILISKLPQLSQGTP